jgi:hypothetical protein
MALEPVSTITLVAVVILAVKQLAKLVIKKCKRCELEVEMKDSPSTRS